VSLDTSAQLRLGTLHLDVALHIEPGETVALLGPNGAGKSTVLRLCAGLHALDGGHITLDGTVLDDPSTNTFVEPQRRPIGVVFQDYLLFPHLSVLENVAFGLRARGLGRAEAHRRATGWLDRMELDGAARRRVQQLSGGQQQRVALARALVTEPRLLLLDEPLAALDAGTRNGVRRELRQHLHGFGGMRLLITHDPLDAHALADRVIVVEAGRITQSGTLAAVTAHPRSRYVAELVGVNLLEGTIRHGMLRLAGGAELVTPDVDLPDGPAFAAVRPQAVSLHLEQPHGSPRNVWPAVIAELDQHADRVRARLDGAIPLTAEITPAALAELQLHPGDGVWASVKATEIATYPA
jgi:molybdate transport system ATP-binding protein